MSRHFTHGDHMVETELSVPAVKNHHLRRVSLQLFTYDGSSLSTVKGIRRELAGVDR